MVIPPWYLLYQILLLTWGAPASTKRTTITSFPCQEKHQRLRAGRRTNGKDITAAGQGPQSGIEVKIKWNGREINTREDRNKHSIRVGSFYHQEKANIWNYLVLSATIFKTWFLSCNYLLVITHKEKIDLETKMKGNGYGAITLTLKKRIFKITEQLTAQRIFLTDLERCSS